MTNPRLAVEVVVGQCIDAAVRPLDRDPLHVAAIKTVIAGEDHCTLQGNAPAWHIAPHVEMDFFPGINRQPDPLELHVQDPL